MELDRKGIYNALYNLINNAIPETPDGGTISVRSGPIEVHSENGIEGRDPHPWRWLVILLAVLLVLVATFMIWAGVSDASAAGGCGGG